MNRQSMGFDWQNSLLNAHRETHGCIFQTHRMDTSLFQLWMFGCVGLNNCIRQMITWLNPKLGSQHVLSFGEALGKSGCWLNSLAVWWQGPQDFCWASRFWRKTTLKTMRSGRSCTSPHCLWRIPFREVEAFLGTALKARGAYNA